MTLVLAMAQFIFVAGAGCGAEDFCLRPALDEACDDAAKGIAAASAGLKDITAMARHGVLARNMQHDERIDETDEYGGRRASVGIRVTHCIFGKDWRYPISSKFNETAGAHKP